MKRGDFDAGDTIFKVDESWERDTDKMIERRDVNLLRRDTRGGQIDIHRGNSSKIPFRARACVQFIVPLNRKSIVIDSIVDPSWINFKIVIKKKKEGEKSVVCFQFPRVSVHLLSPIFFNSTASWLHHPLRSHFLPVLFISAKYTAATRSDIFSASSRYRAPPTTHCTARISHGKGQWVIDQIYFIRAI